MRARRRCRLVSCRLYTVHCLLECLHSVCLCACTVCGNLSCYRQKFQLQQAVHAPMPTFLMHMCMHCLQQLILLRTKVSVQFFILLTWCSSSRTLPRKGVQQIMDSSAKLSLSSEKNEKIDITFLWENQERIWKTEIMQ